MIKFQVVTNWRRVSVRMKNQPWCMSWKGERGKNMYMVQFHRNWEQKSFTSVQTDMLAFNYKPCFKNDIVIQVKSLRSFLINYRMILYINQIATLKLTCCLIVLLSHKWTLVVRTYMAVDLQLVPCWWTW
jgi:hypothetical protein